MKTAVKHCVSSAYQIGTGGGVEGRRGLAPPPIRSFLTPIKNRSPNQNTLKSSFIVDKQVSDVV